MENDAPEAGKGSFAGSVLGDFAGDDEALDVASALGTQSPSP